jgi:very-short-patch-repair endonuclease
MRGKQDHSRERALRRDQTEAGRRLWEYLRARRLQGYKFRRQHRIGAYFGDFVCVERGVFVELDGSQHLDSVAYDVARTTFLLSQGYRVLRFWNSDVAERMTLVLDEILRALRTPHPGSLREPVPLPAARGEG